MRILYVTILILIINLSEKTLLAQNPLWTTGTAYTMPYKNLEVSLLRPARYGITRKMELSAHPLGFFAMPHLLVKKMWIRPEIFGRKFLFSSQHGIYYPSPTLKIVRNRNIANLLPADSDIPQIIAFRNELLISHFLTEPTHCTSGDYLLTVRLGIKYPLTFGKSSPPIIYKPILYRETVVFSPKAVWNAGIDLDASLNAYFNYFVDLEFYSIGLKTRQWALESKIGIMGYTGKRVNALIGGKFTYSKIPGNSPFFAMIIADISWRFKIQRRSKKEKGLFSKDEQFKYENWDLKGEIQYRNPPPPADSTDIKIVPPKTK